MKKGTIVFLFTGLALLIIGAYVLIKGVQEKEGFVGDESLKIFVGGWKSERIYFYVDSVARVAMYEAVKRLGGESFGEECVENGYVVWYKEGCEVSDEKLRSRFLELFREEFEKRINISEMRRTVGVNLSDFSFDYEYGFSDRGFGVVGKSKNELRYAYGDRSYSIHPSFEQVIDYDFRDYFEIDRILREEIDCIVVDAGECGLDNNWRVERSGVGGSEYLIFRVTTRDLSYVGNIEIVFAINLNNLDVDKLKREEKLFDDGEL